MEKSGTEEEKMWTARYDKLAQLDRLRGLDLAKRLFQIRYGLNIPEDLIQVAYDEVMDDTYYQMVRIEKIKTEKMIQQRVKRRKLEREWWSQRNWRTNVESFTDFVRRRLTLEEKLVSCQNFFSCPGKITLESVANFFEHRDPVASPWGIIKHPRTDKRIRVNVYYMMKQYHRVIHNREHIIADRLNFIENDYCCKDESEDSGNGGAIPMDVDYTDSEWIDEDDTSTNWNTETGSDTLIDQSDNIWAATTTPKPEISTTDSWNIDTTAQPWNADGSGEDDGFDFDEEDVENDGFGFNEEEEETYEDDDDFGFDDDDDDW